MKLANQTVVTARLCSQVKVGTVWLLNRGVLLDRRDLFYVAMCSLDCSAVKDQEHQQRRNHAGKYGRAFVEDS